MFVNGCDQFIHCTMRFLHFWNAAKNYNDVNYPHQFHNKMQQQKSFCLTLYYFLISVCFFLIFSCCLLFLGFLGVRNLLYKKRKSNALFLTIPSWLDPSPLVPDRKLEESWLESMHSQEHSQVGKTYQRISCSKCIHYSLSTH